jgi:hypothetical protein
MLRFRAFAIVLLLGGAFAACGLDALATGVGPEPDASVDGPRAQRDDGGDGGAAALDADTGPTCAPCPTNFTCTSGACVDNAQSRFTLTSNPSGNWTWAYHLVGTATDSVIIYPGSHTEAAQAGIQAWSRDPGSVTPGVFFNPSSAVVHPYGSFTMQPGELAFHPGALNENSIVRWTAPVARMFSARIIVRGLSGWMGAPPTTTGITVLRGTSVVGTIQLPTPDAGASEIDVGPAMYAPGDTLDVRVDFGANGNYGYDSTGVDVRVLAL